MDASPVGLVGTRYHNMHAIRLNNRNEHMVELHLITPFHRQITSGNNMKDSLHIRIPYKSDNFMFFQQK
jgi:hypothetical protein